MATHLTHPLSGLERLLPLGGGTAAKGGGTPKPSRSSASNVRGGSKAIKEDVKPPPEVPKPFCRQQTAPLVAPAVTPRSGIATPKQGGATHLPPTAPPSARAEAPAVSARAAPAARVAEAAAAPPPATAAPPPATTPSKGEATGDSHWSMPAEVDPLAPLEENRPLEENSEECLGGDTHPFSPYVAPRFPHMSEINSPFSFFFNSPTHPPFPHMSHPVSPICQK